MKRIGNIIKVAVVLYCLMNYGYAQEFVATTVNSPKALAFRSEFESIEATLRSKKSELTTMDRDEQKNNSVEKRTLEKTIDSLSDRYFAVRKTYANEILNSDESQEIVRRMREAEASEPKESANKIKMEYRKKLLDRATQKWRNKEIDRLTWVGEMKAIDNIVNALETVVFVPTVLSSGGHQHE